MRRRCACASVLALIAVFTISGCSSDAGSVSTEPRVVASTDTSTVGTDGELVPIESSNVSMAGYDADDRVMTVLFDSGGLYEYFDVPPRLWEEFIDAQPSPWSQVGYPQLVQGGYAYRRIS